MRKNSVAERALRLSRVNNHCRQRDIFGTAAATLVCTHVALTGSRLAHVLGARLTPRVLLVLGVFAVLAWAWKIAIVRGYLTGTT